MLALVRNIWRVTGPATRTDVLADELDRRRFGGRRLDAMPTGCRFVINAANITTGVRFGFERSRVGDWVIGHVPTATTALRVVGGDGVAPRVRHQGAHPGEDDQLPDPQASSQADGHQRPTLQKQHDDAAAKGQVGRQKVFAGLLDRLDTEGS